MDEIYREYSLLFNGITKAIEELDALAVRLRKLQQEAEDYFSDRGAEPAANGEALAGLPRQGNVVYFPSCGANRTMIR